VVETLLNDPVAGITAVASHQLLPELIDRFRGADHVIFVDASVVGVPGDVRAIAVLPATDGPASSHHLHPGVLLALGLKLYGRMPTGHLITITGQDFGYQEILSLPVRRALAKALQQIKQLAATPTSL
jgi:hydrogenase maturation protease